MKHEPLPDLQWYVQLARSILEKYVRHPDFLEVTGAPSSNSNGFFLSVRGHMADQSKLIGAQARNIKALQTIMQAIGSKRNHTVHVSILETTKGKDEPNSSYAADPSWDADRDTTLSVFLGSIATLLIGENAVCPTPVGDRTRLCIDAEKQLDPAIEAALNTIFRAIGRSAGRIVSVHATTNQSDADAVGSGPRPG